MCILSVLTLCMATIAEPTYSGSVAALLHKNCAGCHRSGEVGPFPLISYEDARKRAGFIAKQVRAKKMPPWKAEAGHGEFFDERRLTEAEISTLEAWAAAGAPRGDASAEPAVPTFTDGWQLGKPDLIVRMPAAFTIPADGRDIYQIFVMPSGLTETRTVAAMEFRPGNRRVVHHAIAIVDSTGTARRRDAATPEPGYPTFGGFGILPTGFLGGWAPGNLPHRLQEGMGRELPAGADIVVQIHYHPTGKPESDRSELGLYFTPKPAAKLVRNLPLVSRDIDIPAGESAYKRMVRFTTPEQLTVVGIMPHMHLLGREMKTRAIKPDGSEIPLVWIRDWDFNWQDTYLYRNPITVPAGTRFEVDAVYDNSAANPRNPQSPPKRVVWGEQTENEMCVCFMAVVTKDNAAAVKLRQEFFKQLVTPSMILRFLGGD